MSHTCTNLDRIHDSHQLTASAHSTSSRSFAQSAEKGKDLHLAWKSLAPARLGHNYDGRAREEVQRRNHKPHDNYEQIRKQAVRREGAKNHVKLVSHVYTFRVRAWIRVAIS